jgi:hypothetical protein
VNNGIRDEGARALATSPYLGRLTALNLEGNHLGDAGTEALKARFGGRAMV